MTFPLNPSPSASQAPMRLLSLVSGSPPSGLDCSTVPSEWKTNMCSGKGASGIRTIQAPTIAGEPPLPLGAWWQPVIHKTISAMFLKAFLTGMAPYKDSHWLLLCCFALLSALDAEFIGDVVLKDVAHELHGFPPDSLCGHYLDVVEPFVRV